MKDELGKWLNEMSERMPQAGEWRMVYGETRGRGKAGSWFWKLQQREDDALHFVYTVSFGCQPLMAFFAMQRNVQ